MSEDKLDYLLGRIRDRAEALPGNQQVFSTLHDAVRALDRIRGRERRQEGYERVEIAQSRGPKLEFSGRLLCEASGGEVSFELWETPAGAWIAVTYARPRDKREITAATVVPPGDDDHARRFAVMEHWHWQDRARAMVGKLGWSLREDVA